MDMDAIIAEAAAAVGLAEGEAGVRDVLRAIAVSGTSPASRVSRSTGLPVPIVAAICNELRRRSVVDATRPARLTPWAREALAGAVVGDLTCPSCGGLGQRVPAGLAGLAAELERAAAGAPRARPDLDQAHCTVRTKIHRVLRMHEAGALAGARIALLGDDDLIAVAIAAFARATGTAARIRRLAVVDSDPAVLRWIAEQAAGSGVGLELVEHDLRRPLPAGLAGGFDVACTDPPYTVPGAELFLSRAVSVLDSRPGRHVFFSFGPRRPEEALATQRLIARLGLVIRSVTPNFNSYAGAGILAGTSHLYHLRSAAAARPVIEGDYDGPLYTADARAARARPYRCAGCGAVHLVGPAAGPGRESGPDGRGGGPGRGHGPGRAGGGRAGGSPDPAWALIAELRAAGCPACGGTTFRPMPRSAARPRGPAARRRAGGPA